MKNASIFARLDIKRDNYRRLSSCNFCSDGDLSPSGTSIIRPYEEVTFFTKKKGSGVAVCICDNCLNELIEFNKDE